MNPFKKDDAPFLADIATHAGRYRGVKGSSKFWEVEDPTIKPFDDITETVCSELSRCRFPRSALVIFDIFLCGGSVASADVYVMLAGAAQQHRKKAVKRLRKSCLTKKYPGLKIDHWDWPPQAPQITMMGTRDDASLSWTTTVYRSNGYELHSSGKSPDRIDPNGIGTISYRIVATGKSHSDNQRGVLNHYVTVGGKPFLLAPAHIFLPDEPEEVNDESDADNSDSESTSYYESDSDSSFNIMLRAGSATPPELQSWSTADSMLDDARSSQTSTHERRSAERKGKQPELAPSGPMLDVACARILSTKFDYVLIPVHQHMKFHLSLRQLWEGTISSFPFSVLDPYSKARQSDLRCDVSVATPSQGFMRGTIDSRPVMMRLPYSKTFSRLYPVNLPSPVSKGDCGSAVFNRLHMVYGFIAAGSAEGNVAYIIPAADILDDIRTRFDDRPHPILGFDAVSVPQRVVSPFQNPAQNPPEPSGSWQIVISELPSAATESFVRHMMQPNKALTKVEMQLPLFGTATATFASQAGALEACEKLDGLGQVTFMFHVPSFETVPVPPSVETRHVDREDLQNLIRDTTSGTGWTAAKDSEYGSRLFGPNPSPYTYKGRVKERTEKIEVGTGEIMNANEAIEDGDTLARSTAREP